MTPAPAAREGRELRVLTCDPRQPSFHYRIAPLLPHLQALGRHCTLDVLPEQRYGWRIWRRADALRHSTAVLLHKLRLQPWEMRWVARLNPHTVFDVDDVIWRQQPKWVGQVRPALPARQRKFDGMCRHATLTMAGNAVLADDPFTRGKCAFNLLQCMAAGLTCIASPVGANREVVVDGRTAFEHPLADAPGHKAMGRAGRARALQVYDQRVVLPRAAALFDALAKVDARPA